MTLSTPPSTSTSTPPSTLTTEAGCAVGDNRHSQVAGRDGPVLLQDAHLLEKLARFNRERIPERVVHAVGTGVHGTFEVTSPRAAELCRADLFSAVGKKTPVFARLSTVASARGAPDTLRDPRGFAVKFYTREGNWDLVGNNTPIFFIRDGISFPDFVHSQKADPYTNRSEPNNVWEFFVHHPEATHQFIWLFGPRGLPASLRHMDGFGSHTFMWVNEAGARVWVKLHFKTEQGIRCMSEADSQIKGGQDASYMHKEMYSAIEGGHHPSWRVMVQVMPEADAPGYRFDPFDLTKVWPFADYPRVEIGRMVLNRLPDNYFADTEQAAFNPANFVPGMAPSPDRVLQARLFGYGDAQRYRLGVNHTRLPVNAPRNAAQGTHNYGRDGAMRFDDNGGGRVNFADNMRGGAESTGVPWPFGAPVGGHTGPQARALHAEDDDYTQGGNLFRLMPANDQQAMVQALAGSLRQVDRPQVRERAVGHFARADGRLGQLLNAALGG